MTRQTPISAAFLVALALLMPTAALAVPDLDEDRSGFYFGLQGNLSFLDDTDVSAGQGSSLDNIDTLEFGTGLGGAISLGYQPEAGSTNYEVRLQYTQYDIDSAGVNSNQRSGTFDATGTLDATIVTLNAIHYFIPRDDMHPYIGVGLGVADIAVNDFAVDNSQKQASSSSGSDTVFAYTLMLGMNYDVTVNSVFYFGYQYTGALDPKLSEAELSYGVHEAVLGIRYFL